MTRLRKMMLEELQRRNYSESTTRGYLRAVRQFAQHFGKSPDKLGPNELRSYQAYLLKERKLAVGTMCGSRGRAEIFLCAYAETVSVPRRPALSQKTASLTDGAEIYWEFWFWSPWEFWKSKRVIKFPMAGLLVGT